MNLTPRNKKIVDLFHSGKSETEIVEELETSACHVHKVLLHFECIIPSRRKHNRKPYLHKYDLEPIPPYVPMEKEVVLAAISRAAAEWSRLHEEHKANWVNGQMKRHEREKAALREESDLEVNDL